MKFSFDFENYRKNLADELKEKRKESKEGAKEILRGEKETEKYQIAKEIKEVNFEIQKAEALPDAQKKERGVEIEEIDISNQIPEKLKIWIDKERLSEIRRGPTAYETKIWEGRSSDATERATIKEAKEFINRITNGDFYNPKRLNTVINGYTEPNSLLVGFQKKVIEKSKDSEKIKMLKKNSIDNKKEEIHIPTGKGLFPYLLKEKIWFAAGDTIFFNKPSKKIIIANPFSSRFLERIEHVDAPYASAEYPSSIRIVSKPSEGVNEDTIKNAKPKLKKMVEYASKSIDSGIEVYFLNQKGNVNWVDIADWIVDLPAGKLYKISEVESKP